MAIHSTPLFPSGPHPTPSSDFVRRPARPPIYNPYDKFTQPEFDTWIGSITGALRSALGHVDDDEDPNKEVHSLQDTQPPVLDEESGSEFSDDHVFEDSFAELKSRHAKGKSRDPREGPGLGGRSQPIELLSDSEEGEGEDTEEEVDSEEKGGDESDSEEYDDEGGYDCGDQGAVTDEEVDAPGDIEGYDSEGPSIVKVSTNSPSPEIVELISNYDEEESKERSASDHEPKALGVNDDQILARVANGAHKPDDIDENASDFTRMSKVDHNMPQKRYHDELEHEEDDENAGLGHSLDDEEFPPLNELPPVFELPDPWAGPRTYAEDFYSGGDLREPMSDSAVVLSPSHLTPVHDLQQDFEPVGMTLTPIATPLDPITPDRSQRPVFDLTIDAEDNDILPNSSPPVSSPVEDRARHVNAPLGLNYDEEDPLNELYMEANHHNVSSAIHKNDEYERDAEISSRHETLLPAVAQDTRDSASPVHDAHSDHSEHLDWNWPPAFPQGKFASRAGHLESSPAKDGSDDEALGSDEDIQGPLPLGTSDLLYDDLDDASPASDQIGLGIDEDYDALLESRPISHEENTVSAVEAISEGVEEIIDDSIFDFLSNPEEADALHVSGSGSQSNVAPISSTSSQISGIDTTVIPSQQDSDVMSSSDHATTALDAVSRQNKPETTPVPTQDSSSRDQFTSGAEFVEGSIAHTPSEVKGPDFGSDIQQISLENAVPQAEELEVITPTSVIAVDPLDDAWVMPENNIMSTSLSAHEPQEIQSSQSQSHLGLENGLQEPSNVAQKAEQERISSSGETQDQLETQHHSSGMNEVDDMAISSPARVPAPDNIGSPLPSFIHFSPFRSPPVLINVPGTPHLVLSPRDTPGGPVPVSVPVSSSILQELSRRLSSSDTNSNGLIIPRNERDSPTPAQRLDTHEPVQANANEARAQDDDEQGDNSKNQESPVIDGRERDIFDTESFEDAQTSNISGDSVHDVTHLPIDFPQSPIENMDTLLPDNDEHEGRKKKAEVSPSHTLQDNHDQSPHTADVLELQEPSHQRDSLNPLDDEDKNAVKDNIVDHSSHTGPTQKSPTPVPSPPVEDAFKLMGNDSQVAPGAVSEGEDESEGSDIGENIEDRALKRAPVEAIQDSPEDSAKENHASGASVHHVPTRSSASSDESLSAEVKSPRTKRKRTSSTSRPGRLTRSMSSRNLMAGARSDGQPKETKRKPHPSHNKASAPGNTSDLDSISSGATTASRMLDPSSRHSSRASSVISSAPSTSSLSIQPSPTVDRLTAHGLHPAVPPPIFHTHGALHHHHHPPKPPSTSSQLEHVTFSSTTVPPKEKETVPATPAAAVSNTARSKMSTSSPVTRSNCRFHKISLPKEEGGTRVSFVVPGCSLGDADLMHEQEIQDHGPASYEDHKYLIGSIESLELSSYLIGVLRQLVGVDLLRENEVFYLASPGEDVPPRKGRRSSAVSRLASRDAPPTVLRSTPGSPLVSVTSRRSPAASLVRAPVSAAGSTSTSASFRLRARGSEGDSFSMYSPSDGNLTDPEGDVVPETKRRKKSSMITGGDHLESISGTSKQGPADHKIRRRRSRRLNSDAAAYKPATDEENESADEEGIADKVRRRRNPRGTKRPRAEQAGNEEDQSESRTKKQRGPP